MTEFEAYYLALVLGAFSIFAGTLAIVSWWERHGRG